MLRDRSLRTNHRNSPFGSETSFTPKLHFSSETGSRNSDWVKGFGNLPYPFFSGCKFCRMLKEEEVVTDFNEFTD